MKKTLHIITRPNDALAKDLIGRESTGNASVEIVDCTQGEPDYKALVEKIFAAESVQVW
jgi:hypothetical protein